MEYKTIIFDVQDNIATITLNRPEVGNALNADMTKELMSAALHCFSDRAVRVVILTGAGTMFCSGGDINDFNVQGGEQTEDFTLYLFYRAGIKYNL